jgi:signal peptidase I
MKHLFRGMALVPLVIGLLVVAGRLRVEPVLTGSMAPGIPVGTLVAVTPASSVHVGEVIMFVPPGAARPVLHRVVSVDGGVRTKGDANAAADPWVLSGGFWRLRWASPEFGRALAALRASVHGPGLLLWPGLLLVTRLRRQPYRPKHCLV